MTTRTRSALTGLLDTLVIANPGATAVYDVADGEIHAVTRARFRDRVEHLRTELDAVGVRRGQCIAVLLPNWSDALVWQFAAAQVGAHVIGVNTRYNVAEVAHILAAARPAVVAVAPDFHGLDLYGILRSAHDQTALPAPAVAVVAGPGRPSVSPAGFDLGAGCWAAETGDTRGARAPDTPDMVVLTPAGLDDDPADDITVAFTTSGSTGIPKLAAHRDSAVVAHARADAEAMRVRDGDVLLCVLPVSGVFGYSAAFAGLAGGGALLMEPVFHPAETLLRMGRFGVTHAVGGDDLFGRLLDTWQGGERVDLASLRWLGIADFLGRSHEVATWLRDEFGTHTTGVFGSSEIFALVLLWAPDDPERVRWNGGGRPVDPSIEVRVVDPFDGRRPARGEQGELQFRGPTVVDAYLGDPGAPARSFTADGWFRSGDLGIATGDGGFSYVCRMGDVLRLRGFLVDPAEIEHRLADHPAVQTAKVVGITDAGGHTVAVGFVVLADDTEDVDADALKTWCRDRLAAFKVPTIIHIINEMPTTVGGNGSKIRAAVLRDWAAEWADEERDHRRD
ncbi:AMP-binding protein [Gordonia rhizosphera]|uniref:Long-chain-fatty-acid--CoA ligase n=1 Tax=Gordonia rhizosphera NBRC 16068 TaxID=1108045 RepID=K6WA48_9ACTN|nr:AMP-binding protein [Gordonia rhizosphera]GAB90631.1 putative acid--CoA ligase [Gordonia rhizosphera NBRC 16068]